jgi:hypothetical protein
MPARPQFSLRWLLGAVTACCIVVGGLATDWGDRVGFWLTLLISVGASTAVLACLVRLASGAAVPSRRQLATRGLAGAFLLFLLWGLPAHWVHDIWTVWSILSLSLWVTDVAVWGVLRREQDDALLVEARHAARISLAILGGAAVVSALLLLTTFFIREEWRLEPGTRHLEPSALFIVVCAGIVSAFPWLRLLRRRAVAHHRPGFAEYVSLTALVTSSLIALLAMAAAVMLWENDWPGRGSIFFSKSDAFLLFYFFPLIAASVVALVGLFIQLWRDQWHRLVTIMTCTLLTANWLVNSFYVAAN